MSIVDRLKFYFTLFLKEPLVHFLFFGSLLYLYASTQEVSVVNKRVITLSSYEKEKIRAEYQPEVIDAVVAYKEYEKVLLDEADALQIAQQDSEIATLLLQKMKILLANNTKVIEPTETQLHRYYRQNIQEYSKVEHLSFVQIYFSDENATKMAQTLEMLHLVDANETLAPYLGDKILLQEGDKYSTFSEIQKRYGRYFALKLFALKSKIWHAPIKLQSGASLIYIVDKKVAEAYPFDDVIDRVYDDYLYEARETVKESGYKKIATQYLFEE